ncbi:ABC transporter permease [Micromonospora sp. NPDC049559]|uniref:ABC transporter permease n=1 Tax=Micromonospora sp. NPDC049559 TaxID=3155923 RepID=UPI0034369661
MTATTAHRSPDTARRSGDGGLPGAIVGEWTKLWSVRSTWWSLLASAVLMAAAAGQLAIYTANGNTNADPADDQGIVAVGGSAIGAFELAQYAIIALAVLVLAGEYSAGTIRTTLQCVPSRGRLLLAKATLVAGVSFVAGLLLGVLGIAVADPVLGEWGRLDPAEAAGDVLAVGAYSALIGVFALGVGAALRGAVGALITVFLLLSVVPAMLGLLDLEMVRRFVDALPGVAGGHFMRGDGDTYPAPVGLALLAGWAAVALGAGHAVLRRRDA